LNIVARHHVATDRRASEAANPCERIWTVTNAEQAAAVRKQVPAPARKRVLIEPMGLNTAVAIGLAAIHVRRAARGDALMAVLPADHYIEQPQNSGRS